jgi:iron complex outermembrane receptor protein
MGAPQHHDQRSYTLPIATYSEKFAKKLNIPVNSTDEDGTYLYRPLVYDMGINYNQHWGYFRRDRYNADAPEERLSEKTNIYHKPQFTLRDYWTPSDRLSVSNILYLSIGHGGGTRPRSSLDEEDLITDPEDPRYGTIDWQAVYDINTKPVYIPFGDYWEYPINDHYNDSLYFSENYMTKQHNDHFWYGLLSTANYKVNNQLDLAAGIDLRSYKGIHYTTITDLLGGDYAIDEPNNRIDYNADHTLGMKYEGDTISYYEEGLVRWGGVFLQAEYKLNRLTTFINLTSALNGYKWFNYFEYDTESDWVLKPGFTFKTGANYNLNRKMNIFLNLGYLSKVRALRHFFVNYTTEIKEHTENEKVMAIEGGYNYHSPRFTTSINTYITKWNNKPTYDIRSLYYPDPEEPKGVPVYAYIPGMDALHKGLEIDFIYKVLSIMDIEGLFSLGDWRWDTKLEGLQFFTKDHEPVDMTTDFDARGIHVGDAAQFQMGGSVRLEPVKGLYINGRITHFGKYYSNFTPESTTDDKGNVIDSWKIPHYRMVDLHAGYRFSVKTFQKARFSLRFSMLNILNTMYVADATNNDSYNPLGFKDFDAKSATVFFGMGRRFTTAFSITF